MKKTLAVAILLVLALVGSVVFFIFQKKDSAVSTDQEPQEIPTIKQATVVQDDKSAQSYGSYLPYSSQAFAATATFPKRVLFFYANWCPTCKPADESFSQNAQKIPKNVAVIRVNYNDSDTDQAEKDLAKKYAVTYQHTFVQIDQQGNEVAKWNGGKIEELLKNIK
jgi:thioredoxin 1